MRVNRITLNNFRQFYGPQTLKLSTDKERNVTLIHAENGVGKTTLLNSLLWALYQETTSRFEQEKKIVSFAAVAEGRNRAEVSVHFDFQGREFEISRRADQGPAGYTAKVAAVELNHGVRKPIDRYETFVNQVLPKKMARYFFFDGEHAESFASAGNQEKVRDAITSMLGCDIVDEAEKDLTQLRNEFVRAIREMGEADESALLDELSELEDEIAGFHRVSERDLAEKRRCEGELARIEEKLSELANQIQSHRDATDLENQRRKSEQRRKGLERELLSIEQRRLKWVADSATVLVSRRLQATSLEFIDEESLKGRIPSPYNEQFINDLLSGRVCICHRSLEPMTAEYAAVMSMLPKAANKVALDRLVQVRTHLEEMRRQVSEAPMALEKIQQDEVAKREEIRREETTFSEVEAKLKSIDIEAVKNAANQRKQLEDERTHMNRKIGELQRALTDTKGEIERRQLDIKNRENKRRDSELPKRYRELMDRAKAKLAEAKSNYVEDARAWIADRINTILERTTRRAYTFRFGDRGSPKDPDGLSFSLRYSQSNEVVPRSGGENQLTTLFFTAGLAAFAEHRMSDPNPLLLPGTQVPLVLDSPFGQLDLTYRSAVAREVPTMAQQVVLLLSSSQSTPEVLEALEGRIGRRYLLKLHNTESKGARHADELTIGGQRNPLVVFDSARSWTEIVEVST